MQTPHGRVFPLQGHSGFGSTIKNSDCLLALVTHAVPGKIGVYQDERGEFLQVVGAETNEGRYLGMVVGVKGHTGTGCPFTYGDWEGIAPGALSWGNN